MAPDQVDTVSNEYMMVCAVSETHLSRVVPYSRRPVCFFDPLGVFKCGIREFGMLRRK